MYFTLAPLPRNLLRSGIVLIFLLPLLSVCYLAPTRAAADPTATPVGTLSLTAGSERTDSFGIKQVYVPAGCFMMGSSDAQVQDAIAQLVKGGYSQAGAQAVVEAERPEHGVCITKAYWLDEFDVTNAAFDAFVKAGGYTNDSLWSADGLSWKQSSDITGPDTTCTEDSSQPNQPRVCVGYYEAEAYANWRGGRLPTEAEWEYAARGPNSLIYPWGDSFDKSKTNTTEGGPGKITAVDAYPTGKSWVGAYDMAGNVFQWVADGLFNFNASPTPDPSGESARQVRAFRGGAWFVGAGRARAAGRNFYGPFRQNSISFRVLYSVTVQ